MDIYIYIFVYIYIYTYIYVLFDYIYIYIYVIHVSGFYLFNRILTNTYSYIKLLCNINSIK